MANGTDKVQVLNNSFTSCQTNNTLHCVMLSSCWK